MAEMNILSVTKRKETEEKKRLRSLHYLSEQTVCTPKRRKTVNLVRRSPKTSCRKERLWTKESRNSFGCPNRTLMN